MEELLSTLDKLKLHEESTSETNLDKLLDLLSNEEEDDAEKVFKELLQSGLLSELHHVLTQDTKNSKIKAAQVVAEVAKEESMRTPCVEAGLISPLLQLLEKENVGACIQSCRALGNICFDNDTGRDAMKEAGGLAKLLEFMKYHLSTTGEQESELRMILCGCLVNLTNANESLQLLALESGALELLNQYIKSFQDEKDVIQMALLCVDCLADTDKGKELLEKIPLVSSLTELLEIDSSQEQKETVLDALATMAESDAVKKELAATKAAKHCTTILKEKCKLRDDKSQQLLKLAADLLILILTGDESVEILYNDGEGEIYKETLSWLKTGNIVLQTTAALAIGNFARSDDQCYRLVHRDKIVPDLLNLLTDLDEIGMNTTLHHAVLSTLRNLAIPAENKPKLISLGLIEKVLPLTSSVMTPVIFKLLGVLRMLIDGEVLAATKLGTNKEFVEQVVSWCGMNAHEGVKGEASRMLAWMIKNSRRTEVASTVLECGGLPYLVQMIVSEHTVMQMEALVALTLISALIIGPAEEQLLASDLITNLRQILTTGDTKMEIIHNACTLLGKLGTSEPIRAKIEEQGILEHLPELERKSSQSGIPARAKMLTKQLSTDQMPMSP
ncbi:rap1 GTPase-GDP dissociation stimulator 1 [Lingula anatina]|uniref:Rap1 GTPase-GDP dissociation stimulator 1 n=1 Tax=Lingula anatina TaxID=7574 RepID=A0A1S3K2Q6_LINAN|nr:rap1 GTPase-GDP dissociation stimulator 1 [Lingula anatina]|eukprot:XP_013416802.1 rap1 GTPase-GDP dissociation stimulator 1 [Lingula anatina]